MKIGKNMLDIKSDNLVIVYREIDHKIYKFKVKSLEIISIKKISRITNVDDEIFIQMSESQNEIQEEIKDDSE